jgi:hypothetical protein
VPERLLADRLERSAELTAERELRLGDAAC